MIPKYQQSEPTIIAKYKYCMYHKGYFHGGSNTGIQLIMCNDSIVIPSILQSYILYWYHTYILHAVIDRTKAMICQHLFWPDIRNTVNMEVNNCDTCQLKEQPNIKYGKLPANLADKIP